MAYRLRTPASLLRIIASSTSRSRTYRTTSSRMSSASCGYPSYAAAIAEGEESDVGDHGEYRWSNSGMLICKRLVVDIHSILTGFVVSNHLLTVKGIRHNSDRHDRDQMNIPNAAYGPSKAAVHWLTQAISREDEWLCAFVMHPGYVTTLSPFVLERLLLHAGCTKGSADLPHNFVAGSKLTWETTVHERSSISWAWRKRSRLLTTRSMECSRYLRERLGSRMVVVSGTLRGNSLRGEFSSRAKL